MSTNNTKHLEAVIQSKMPGYKIVQPVAETTLVTPDATSPPLENIVSHFAPKSMPPTPFEDLETLRTRFLGNTDSVSYYQSTEKDMKPHSLEVVLVESSATDDTDKGPGQKAVLLDDDDDIIGFQG